MKKVLIIEDDPIVGHIYKTRLTKEGYEVQISPDGQTGFYQIHDYQPDAVLLDLMLPKMNGVEILKKIRAQGQFQRTPIIVFTNAYVPNMIHEAFQAGATHVFNKATLTPRQIIDAMSSSLFSVGARNGANGNGNGQAASENGPSEEKASFDSEPPFHAGSSGTSVAAPARTVASVAHGYEAADAEKESEADIECRSEALEAFSTSIPETLGNMRKLVQEFTKCQDEQARMELLCDLYRKVHAVTGSAGVASMRNISQMAAALEVLIKELYEKPKNINASTMRTVAHCIDFIAELFTKGASGDLLDARPVNILVVDDEILSRRAVTYALEKANLKSVSVEDPQTALNLANENTFDLIFLDVQMPGMDGFELCTKIRTLPANKTTPIIFVTSLSDFKSRAKSSLSGGTDLIAKPFMFIELSAKALSCVLRGRLATR